ncbi:MAG TPA: TauD/TfdA family dioxygenase [Thermoanaerobaculia bacterium]|jgi:alpha-ketoglutarate-dependent taurine dioxygenase
MSHESTPIGLKISSRVWNQEHNLPLLIEPESPSDTEGLIAWWRENRPWLDGKLSEHGAVLFRGFGIDSQARLRQVSAATSGQLLDYVDGNSPRTKMEAGVYTSTEYPPEYFISMHNELSYARRWPSRLNFCCVTPPATGGETPLADSRRILRELRPEIVDEFRRKGVKYIRNLHGGAGFGPSWQKTFETDERALAEKFIQDSGMNAEWQPDGSLRITSVRPATTVHPVTGEEVWFNQADQFHPSTHQREVYESLLVMYQGREDQLPQHATFGDGTPLEESMLDEIRETIRRCLVLSPWQQGDLVVVDNVLVCHGRMPFTGPRKILVTMA